MESVREPVGRPAGSEPGREPARASGPAREGDSGGAALQLLPQAPGLDDGLSEPEARRADLLWAGGMTAGIGLMFVVLAMARGAALPVLVALALANILDPVVDALERRGIDRTIGVVGIFVGSVIASLSALLYLVPAFGAELAKLPDFFKNIARVAIPRLEALIGQPLPGTVRDAATVLGQTGSGLTEKVFPQAATLALQAAGGTASIIGATVALLVIPVLLFYLLRDYDQLVARVRGLIPRKYERLVSGRFAQVDSVLGAFVRGQIIVGAILSVIFSLGLSAARLDLAVVIGLVAGFGNMVPYLGTAIGLVLALLSVAIGWQGPWQLVVVAATFAVAQVLEGFVITPRVVGERVGLSALAVMVALLAFGELLGFTGILLAVPVTAALKVVVDVVLFRYRRSALYRGPA